MSFVRKSAPFPAKLCIFPIFDKFSDSSSSHRASSIILHCEDVLRDFFFHQNFALGRNSFVPLLSKQNIPLELRNSSTNFLSRARLRLNEFSTIGFPRVFSEAWRSWLLGHFLRLIAGMEIDVFNNSPLGL